jgi:hypothetical protein
MLKLLLANNTIREGAPINPATAKLVRGHFLRANQSFDSLHRRTVREHCIVDMTFSQRKVIGKYALE